MRVKNTGAEYMKNFVIKSVFVFFWLLIVLVGLTFAHPHVFIAQNLKVQFDEKGMAGFYVH